ncbi:dicarboxylate/amino acid:cation symporter [Candidatus Atribacteria bacterium MT.SAG.1]|nr:dicarboxylate/amino acid:cation symporter [Candidatus Atribacteria bacterium MT.SAG.1]
MKLFQKVLIGFVLGAILGAIGGPGIVWIKPVGTVFVSLLKMLIIPLIFATLVVGVASIAEPKKLGRVAGKTIIFYLATTAFAIIIGLALGNIIQPGAGMNLVLEGPAKEAVGAPSLIDTFVNLIPKNPVGAMAQGKVLQVIVFALFLGFAMTKAGEKGKAILKVFEGFAETMYKLTGIVMGFAPYGVFALIATTVGTHGLPVLIPFAKLIFAVYLGVIIQEVVVYSGMVSIIAKMNPIKFFKGFSEASLLAFSTCSSSATLPVSMRAAQDNLKVSPTISSFVQPLGATINMDGTALYQGVCALFIAQAYGIPLGFGGQLTVLITALLASIGTAGVPGAGLVMLTVVLASVGLPLEGIVLIAGVDRILDMARTSCNVTGDAACAVVVAKTEGELDKG